jgi:hypothetical protein
MHGPSVFIDLASFERYPIAAYPADVNRFSLGCHVTLQANHLNAQETDAQNEARRRDVQKTRPVNVLSSTVTYIYLYVVRHVVLL